MGWWWFLACLYREVGFGSLLVRGKSFSAGWKFFLETWSFWRGFELRMEEFEEFERLTCHPLPRGLFNDVRKTLVSDPHVG